MCFGAKRLPTNYIGASLFSFHTVERKISSVGERLLFLKDAPAMQSFLDVASTLLPEDDTATHSQRPSA